MSEHTCDVLVVGSGFGGSLMAMVLAKLGFRSLVVERGNHPRFALGESSTPLANLVLEQLATTYDIPELLPCCQYGTWKRDRPELVCGLKRGFSYFEHQAHQPFRVLSDRSNQLLVAASNSEEDADTHWLRSDFDQYLVSLLPSRGVQLLDRVNVDSLEHIAPQYSGTCWTLRGTRCDEPLTLHARFMIDASGSDGFLARHLALPSSLGDLKTYSRGLFSHFHGVHSWQSILAAGGNDTSDHTFPCNAAALHHVFKGGWMYLLEFENGVTSAGFSLDPRLHPQPSSMSPEEEWRQWLNRFPSIAEQFADAEPIAPVPGRIVRTGRLQRFVSQAADTDWALLPTTAGIIDALHSSGNAHTLYGIERLGRAFSQYGNTLRFHAALHEYAETTACEIKFIDELVAGCYKHFERFPKMVLASMCYFVAAHSLEGLRRSGLAADTGFLRATDRAFRKRIRKARFLIDQQENTSRDVTAAVATLLAPDNSAGFLNADRRNNYPYQAE